MARYTPNLGLIKPDGTDAVAISQLNQNSNIVDEIVGRLDIDVTNLKNGVIPKIDVERAVEEYLDEHGIEVIAMTEQEIDSAISAADS